MIYFFWRRGRSDLSRKVSCPAGKRLPKAVGGSRENPPNLFMGSVKVSLTLLAAQSIIFQQKGAVVQRISMPDCRSGGRGFESRRPRFCGMRGQIHEGRKRRTQVVAQFFAIQPKVLKHRNENFAFFVRFRTHKYLIRPSCYVQYALFASRRFCRPINVR